MSKLRLSTTLTAVLFCIALGAHTAVGEIPRGVFSLFGAGQFSNDSVLANPEVAGVSIRQDWAQLEPTEGNLDFTFFDAEIARVSAAGKQILLRIWASQGLPRHWRILSSSYMMRPALS